MHVHDDPELDPAAADLESDEMTDAPVDDDGVRLAVDLAAGSREALAAVYERWGSLVHTIAYRALGDRHDAEDVTQQVFVSAWNGRHTLRPEAGSLAAWLVGITKHRIADLRTQRYRAHRNLQAVAAETATRPTAVDDDLAERLLIVHELERIGDPRATVLRMAFIEDRSHDDIARALELPLGTVKSHVRRGLTQLRRRLEEVRRATP